jgi:hypothetical protein
LFGFSALAMRMNFSKIVRMEKRWMSLAGLVAMVLSLTQCGVSSGGFGNMGGPSIEERAAKIAAEPSGNFYYGRRYFVEKTRFWGYLREPRQDWSRAKRVMMREDKKRVPDRFHEDGPPGKRYAQDNNVEYRIRGNYTGREVYDPNSNQFLPEFMLTGYEVLDQRPGWLFKPSDRYNRYRITLLPR